MQKKYLGFVLPPLELLCNVYLADGTNVTNFIKTSNAFVSEYKEWQSLILHLSCCVKITPIAEGEVLNLNIEVIISNDALVILD